MTLTRVSTYMQPQCVHKPARMLHHIHALMYSIFTIILHPSKTMLADSVRMRSHLPCTRMGQFPCAFEHTARSGDALTSSCKAHVMYEDQRSRLLLHKILENLHKTTTSSGSGECADPPMHAPMHTQVPKIMPQRKVEGVSNFTQIYCKNMRMGKVYKRRRGRGQTCLAPATLSLCSCFSASASTV